MANKLRGANSGCATWQLQNKVHDLAIRIAAGGNLVLDLRLIGGTLGRRWARLQQVCTDTPSLARVWAKPTVLFALPAPLRRAVLV